MPPQLDQLHAQINRIHWLLGQIGSQVTAMGDWCPEDPDVPSCTATNILADLEVVLRGIKSDLDS